MTTPTKGGAYELVGFWCSAYGHSDAKQLAALETEEIEIVDRFGDLHDLIGRKGREEFWADGFEMIQREHFHPECAVQHVRLIRWNAVIAQVTLSYDEGIALKGGERLPPFSEAHTFFLVWTEGRWLISAQNMVKQDSGSKSNKTYVR